MLRQRPLVCIALAVLTGCSSEAESSRLVLGTTHTVEDSGLLDALTLAYRDEQGQGERLSVVVAGSGEILAMAARGDVDVVLSHSPAAEIALVGRGVVESRREVMHNDFVLVGPAADPAGALEAGSAADALRRIAAVRQRFVSRGDDSGTHVKERELWKEAGVEPAWSDYVEAGAGMADVLRIAAQRDAYTLADRATFEVLRDQLDLVIIHEGGIELLNQYSVLVMMNGANTAGARRLADWLLSDPAQEMIEAWRGPAGARVLFIPDAA